MKCKMKIICILLISLILTACGNSTSDVSSGSAGNKNSAGTTTHPENIDPSMLRDNTSVVYQPEASGTNLLTSSVATVDISNAGEGYIMVKYSGTSPKVKLQITAPNGTKYTYNLTAGNDYEVFPLLDSGSYTIGVLENASGNEYFYVLMQEINVEITNTFGPFLYPNQYVSFTQNSTCVAKAKELAANCMSDIDVVANIFEYVVNNIEYDYDLANNVKSGYLPTPDITLSTNKGICLDYSALMAAMLRSQGIPTRLEVGNAGTVYHAWISTYISDIGWVSGIIYFDGTDWSIMDPTFAANNSAKAVKEFIGDGENYSVKYIY